MNGAFSTNRPALGKSAVGWSTLRSGVRRQATPGSAHAYCRTALRIFQLSAVSAAVLPACADQRAPERPSEAARALPRPAAMHADVPIVCVTARDREINLGTVKSGSMCKLAFQITNDSWSSIRIARITTSCPCLKVVLPTVLLSRGDTASGMIEFNSGSEPMQASGLLAEVQGFSPEGRGVFQFLVHVDIDSQSSSNSQQ